MEPPIQEQASLRDLLRKSVNTLYENSRPQFHAALFVLLYAAFFTGIMQAALFVISLTPWFSFILDYTLIGILVGCFGLAELVRGHVKLWLGYAVEDWCYPAMPVGGAVAGASYAALMVLMWDMPWLGIAICILGGAALYTLVGGMFHLQSKK